MVRANPPLADVTVADAAETKMERPTRRVLKTGRSRKSECGDLHLDSARCRQCERARAKAYRAAHATSVHKKDQARKAALRAGGGEAAERARARAIVGVYVRRGKITRPATCSECSNPRPLPYHADPGQPLAVEWLCLTCRRDRTTIGAIEQAREAAERARIESEEEASRRIAEANAARRSGEEIYDALPPAERAAIDDLYAANDRAAIEDRFGTHARAIVEFLDRRANHQRLREMMRRRLGSA